jgi:hypothetical protein
VRDLTLGAGRKGPRAIGIRLSGFTEARVSYSLKSQIEISRFSRSRRSLLGHVAQDPRESGFGIQDFPVQEIANGEIMIPRFPKE